MANANKIDQEVKISGASRFLPKEITDIDGVKEFYHLEEELEKTKKNKNLFLYTSIFLFFVLVVGSVIYTTQTIEETSKDFEINISDFEDLRLKDVIDSASRHENNLDLLKMQLDIIKINEKKEILKTQKDYYQNEIDILAKDLPEKETDEMVTINRQEELNAIEKVKKTFADSISGKETEIAKIVKELEKRKKSEEEEKSAFINNVDKLNAIKNAKLKKEQDSGITALKEYYEAYVDYIVLKFNPVFKSKRINTIINTKQGIVEHFSYLDSYDEFLLFEGVFTIYDFKNFRTKIDKFFEITERLNRIPYLNSIKPALKKIDDLTYSISHDYENLIDRIKTVVKSKNDIIAQKNEIIDTREQTIRSKNQALEALHSKLLSKSIEIESKVRIIRSKENTIDAKNKSIQAYQNALATLIQNNNEGGYILQVNSNEIQIYANPTLTITTGTTARIFRRDYEFIGEAKIIELGDTVKARVTGLVKGKTVKPFDKLIFKF